MQDLHSSEISYQKVQKPAIALPHGALAHTADGLILRTMPCHRGAGRPLL